MKISIVTVCFNSAVTIESTIRSVVEQRFYGEIEHIFIDGGSTDKTLDIIREQAAEDAIIVSEPDEGIYDAMSKGVELATGDVVAILNSDDIFTSNDCLSIVSESFLFNPETLILFGDVYFFKTDPGLVSRYCSARSFRPWMVRFGWVPPHPATFVRREVYEQYGPYKKSFRISADFECFVRWFAIEKLPFKYVEHPFVAMRIGGVSTSGISNILLGNKEIVSACRGNGIYTNLLFVMLKIPFKLLQLLKCPPRGWARRAPFV